MTYVANELAEQNRIMRLQVRLRVLELKADGRLSQLDQEALQTIVVAAKDDGAK